MIPAYSMVPPGIEGYTPAMADYAAMSQIDREDEAKKILTELGYGPDHPLKLEIRYNTSENHKNTAIAIQEQLKPFGIEVTMRQHRHQDPLRLSRAEGQFRLRPRRLDRRLQGSRNLPRHLRKASGNNYSGYDSPEFEAAMDKAAAAGGNPDERFKLLADAEAVLIDETGNMPLLYYGYHNLVSPKLKGWEDNVMDVHPLALRQQANRSTSRPRRPLG